MSVLRHVSSVPRSGVAKQCAKTKLTNRCPHYESNIIQVVDLFLTLLRYHANLMMETHFYLVRRY